MSYPIVPSRTRMASSVTSVIVYVLPRYTLYKAGGMF